MKFQIFLSVGANLNNPIYNGSPCSNNNSITTKRINPNDFIQTEIKDLNDVESSEEEDEEEQDAFTADISTFDSGIE